MGPAKQLHKAGCSHLYLDLMAHSMRKELQLVHDFLHAASIALTIRTVNIILNPQTVCLYREHVSPTQVAQKWCQQTVTQIQNCNVELGCG